MPRIQREEITEILRLKGMRKIPRFQNKAISLESIILVINKRGIDNL
jgi:hypothetical protein